MDFDEFSKDIFSARLKEDSKRLGLDLGQLGKNAGIGNLYLYTQNNSKIPRADTLWKLASAGIDINFLLTGKRGALMDEDTKKRFEELEVRITTLESKLFRENEENERLKEENKRLREQFEKDVVLRIPSKLDKQ